MAVLKKFRPRWWLSSRQVSEPEPRPNIALVPPVNVRYDVRPLTVSQLDECWRLDQRCFVDGEAYSRDTFEYLLTAPESVAYRVVMQNGVMAGFVIGLLEPDHTGHITTIGIAPEHRRRRLASCLMETIETGVQRREVRNVRLGGRLSNELAQRVFATP